MTLRTNDAMLLVMNTSRRAFAKSIAIATVAAPVLAQQKEPPPPPSSLGHALGGVVLAESGQFLTADEFLDIEKDLSDSAGAYKTLRAFKLQNSDEPDFTFSSSTKRW
jgi:hypothetical protein